MTIILRLMILRSYFGDCDEIYPSNPNNYVSGLCIGTLAAAAVGSSKSLGELVQAGVDAVRVSLKIGLLAARTAALFGHQRSNSSSYWSHVIAESQYPLALAEKAIASYRDSSVSDITVYFHKPILIRYADDSAPVVAVRQCKRPKLLDSQWSAGNCTEVFRVFAIFRNAKIHAHLGARAIPCAAHFLCYRC